MRNLTRAMLALALTLAVSLSLAGARAADFGIDGVGLEGGFSDDDDNGEGSRGGAYLVWDWPVKWFQYGHWYLGGQWELSASYWDGDEGDTGNGSLGDFGITPVFRIQTDAPYGAIWPFVEGAVGAHFFTDTEFGDLHFGINYSFGDHLGAGVRLGETGQYELGYRYQHLSNAGLSHHNNGINFHLLRLVYHFQ